jgi:hypothetical protein
MGQAKLFRSIAPVFNHKRWRLRGAENFELYNRDLDLAAREVWFRLTFGALTDDAKRADDILAAQLIALFNHVSFEHELKKPTPISQIDEHEPPEVPPPAHPTNHFNLIPELIAS